MRPIPSILAVLTACAALLAAETGERTRAVILETNAIELVVTSVQPLVVANPSQPAELSISIESEGPFDILWQRADGTPLDLSRIEANGLPTLRFTGLEAEDAGTYQAIVSTTDGSVTGPEITLIVREPFEDWWTRLYGTPVPSPDTIEPGWTVSNLERFAFGLNSPTDAPPCSVTRIAPDEVEFRFRLAQMAMVNPTLQASSDLLSWRRVVSAAFTRGDGSADFQDWMLTVQDGNPHQYWRIGLDTRFPHTPPPLEIPPSRRPRSKYRRCRPFFRSPLQRCLRHRHPRSKYRRCRPFFRPSSRHLSDRAEALSGNQESLTHSAFRSPHGLRGQEIRGNPSRSARNTVFARQSRRFGRFRPR